MYVYLFADLPLPFQTHITHAHPHTLTPTLPLTHTQPHTCTHTKTDVFAASSLHPEQHRHAHALAHSPTLGPMLLPALPVAACSMQETTELVLLGLQTASMLLATRLSELYLSASIVLSITIVDAHTPLAPSSASPAHASHQHQHQQQHPDHPHQHQHRSKLPGVHVVTFVETPSMAAPPALPQAIDRLSSLSSSSASSSSSAASTAASAAAGGGGGGAPGSSCYYSSTRALCAAGTSRKRRTPLPSSSAPSSSSAAAGAASSSAAAGAAGGGGAETAAQRHVGEFGRSVLTYLLQDCLWVRPDALLLACLRGSARCYEVGVGCGVLGDGSDRSDRSIGQMGEMGRVSGFVGCVV